VTKARRRTEAGKSVEAPNALVGGFFHSVNKETGRVVWQGEIIGNPEPGWYLVQLFDWMAGQDTHRLLVKFEDMTGWLFYEDAEAMRYSWEHGTAGPGTKYQGKHPLDILVEEGR
jgi:hypothetical protein